MARLARQVEGAHNASGRAGVDRPRRLLPGRLRAHAAAARLHDGQPPDALRQQAFFEALEVAAHHRRHVGVDDGRAGALVLPVLGQHLVGGGDVEAAPAGRLRYRLLVRRVEEGEEEAHRQRLDARRLQEIEETLDLFRVQGGQHLPLVVEALVRLQAQVVGDERRRPSGREVVQPGPSLPADDQHVAEAAGGDEGRPRALALQQGVGGHGGAVHHLLRVPGGLGEALEDAPGRVIGGAGALVEGQAAVLPQQEVGERPADVDAQHGGHGGAIILRARARVGEKGCHSPCGMSSHGMPLAGGGAGAISFLRREGPYPRSLRRLERLPAVRRR